MAEDTGAKLKFYSIGIVTEDKARGSDSIKVSPMEDLHLTKGLIKDQKYDYNTKLPDAKGVKRGDSVKGDNMIIANWLPLSNSNRISAPDVIKNETVLILKYADTDEYYWTTIFREPKIRRLETVLYAFGNLAKGLVAWTKKTSYWFEVSTHDKKVQFHTSKSDGEPYEYDVIFDTREGTVELKDDIGNRVLLNSKESKITITTNKDIELNTQNVTINAKGSTKINTPTTTISGDVTIGGALTTAKGLTSGSSGNFNGSVAVNGNVNATGTITGSNI